MQITFNRNKVFIGSLWFFVLFTSVYFVVNPPSFISQSGDLMAMLHSSRGSVQFKRDTYSMWDYTREKQRFFDGNIIATSPQSEAEVVFIDGTIVKVDENTHFVVTKSKDDRQEMVLSVLSGGFTLVSQPGLSKGGSKLAVDTGRAIVRLPGDTASSLTIRRRSDESGLDSVQVNKGNFSLEWGALSVTDLNGLKNSVSFTGSPIVISEFKRPAAPFNPSPLPTPSPTPRAVLQTPPVVVSASKIIDRSELELSVKEPLTHYLDASSSEAALPKIELRLTEKRSPAAVASKGTTYRAFVANRGNQGADLGPVQKTERGYVMTLSPEQVMIHMSTPKVTHPLKTLSFAIKNADGHVGPVQTVKLFFWRDIPSESGCLVATAPIDNPQEGASKNVLVRGEAGSSNLKLCLQDLKSTLVPRFSEMKNFHSLGFQFGGLKVPTTGDFIVMKNGIFGYMEAIGPLKIETRATQLLLRGIKPNLIFRGRRESFLAYWGKDRRKAEDFLGVHVANVTNDRDFFIWDGSGVRRLSAFLLSKNKNVRKLMVETSQAGFSEQVDILMAH